MRNVTFVRKKNIYFRPQQRQWN